MDNLFSLKGKTAWITGGKRIGKKIAEVLAMHGCNIALSYNRSSEESEETADAAKKYGAKTIMLKVDVSQRESVRNAAAQIKNKFGKLDILVLMASVFDKMSLSQITDSELQKNFDVHVKGTFWPIAECLKFMPKGSHIITISDRTSLGISYAEYLPYIMTKGTVASMTKALAPELGKKGIFINSIAPGPILKPDALPDSEWKKIRSSSVINFSITDEEAVEEFAKLVLYLSKARSTGSVYPLDLGHLFS